MPRKLVEIAVEEITLCQSAANRKKFFIRKQETKMEDFIKELKKFMAEDDEDGKEVLAKEEIAKAEKLPEKAMVAIKAALNLLNKYKSDMPSDVLKAIQTLGKYAAYGYPAAKGDEKAKVEKSDDELLSDAVDVIIKAVDIDDVEKAGKVTGQFSKATIEQIKKIIEICNKLIGEKETKVKKLEELPPEVARDLEDLAELKKFKQDALREKEETQKKEVEELKKSKEELKKEIEELKKSKGVKKGIEGQGDDDGAGDEDDEKDDYPSIPLLVKE